MPEKLFTLGLRFPDGGLAGNWAKLPPAIPDPDFKTAFNLVPLL